MSIYFLVSANPQEEREPSQTERQNSPLLDQEDTPHLDQSDVHKLVSPEGLHNLVWIVK